MELGCDGVLMNTAYSQAKDPVRMARASGWRWKAGRLAYLGGNSMPKKLYAISSPLAGRSEGSPPTRSAPLRPAGSGVGDIPGASAAFRGAKTPPLRLSRCDFTDAARY